MLGHTSNNQHIIMQIMQHGTPNQSVAHKRYNHFFLIIFYQTWNKDIKNLQHSDLFSNSWKWNYMDLSRQRRGSTAFHQKKMSQKILSNSQGTKNVIKKQRVPVAEHCALNYLHLQVNTILTFVQDEALHGRVYAYTVITLASDDQCSVAMLKCFCLQT